MALIKCPSCNEDVSDAAASCPHCGHPLRATTIEKTGKKWKAIKLFSFLAMLLGIVLSFLTGQSTLAALIITVGFFGIIIGFIGSWWFHG
ncbi:MAG TPA: zinc-ribbon domain-containing protein [Patescibacteria group bacterium]